MNLNTLAFVGGTLALVAFLCLNAYAAARLLRTVTIPVNLYSIRSSSRPDLCWSDCACSWSGLAPLLSSGLGLRVAGLWQT